MSILDTVVLRVKFVTAVLALVTAVYDTAGVYIIFISSQGLRELKRLLEKCSIHITVVTKTDEAPE